MAESFKPRLTTAGRNLLNKAIAGTPMQITRAQLGSGKLAASSPIEPLTGLITPKADATVATTTSPSGGEITIGVRYTNSDLAQGFFVNEIGIFAKEEPEGAEILYCYMTLGDYPEWVGPASSGIFTRSFDIPVVVDTATDIIVNLDPQAIVTQEDLTHYPRLGEDGKIPNSYIKAPIKEYGVRIPTDSRTALDRLGDAVGMVAGVANGNVKVQNDFDSVMPWAGMKKVNIDAAGRIIAREEDPDFKLDGTNGNVMTVIPKFWSKLVFNEDGSREVWIASGPADGYSVDPFFTAGGHAYDFRLHSTFPAQLSGDGTKLVSKSGGPALVDKTRAQFRTLAEATAPTISLDDIWADSAIDKLMLVELASRDIQTTLGKGVTGIRYSSDDKAVISEAGANRIVVPNAAAAFYWVGEMIGIGDVAGGNNVAKYRKITGIQNYDVNNKSILFDGAAVSITAGTHGVYGMPQENTWPDIGQNASGQPSGPMPDGQRPVVYRNMVNATHGNIWRFKDGINRNENYEIWVCEDPAQYADDLFAAPYRNSGIVTPSTEGFITDIAQNTLGIIAPAEVGGSSSTYYSDHLWTNAGNKVLRAGGSFYYGGIAGPFNWYLNDSSASSWWHGGAFFLGTPA